MCLLAFAWKIHPEYKLIFLGNRDEFYSRKTQIAHYWRDKPQILAGKDLSGGGTWLGVNTTPLQPKFATITNYRDIKNIKPNAPSRGELVLDFLENQDSPESYMQKVAQKAALYNGFNLLVSDWNEMYYFSNYQHQIRPLESGLYGLSNHLLNTPWFKVERLKQKLMQRIETNDLEPTTLLNLLNDTTQPLLDSEVQQTGLPIEKERMLSPIFIQSADYGTRTSSVVMIDYHNNLHFVEKQHAIPQWGIEESIQNFRLHLNTIKGIVS
ncbi:MAG: NRDE family protein [Microscillaceae bacterium]|nr:NRDE family protein [Microscillaceae bacterium]MDW8461179.1 NRDE family protein [Cytophagales bacterium]